ncbi:hypothetical protein [Melittangium boletus]|uniref:hypothetical protein n=1 Tax=Melittangium boletus TaxID=83453 RepID=UPI003DA622A5
MSDFIAKYELGQEPPGTWESDVGRLAVSAGIEVLAASRVGRQLTLTIRVPGGAGALAGDIAEAFWRDVVPALAGPDAEGSARRVESSERPGRSASAWALRVLPMVIGATVFLAFFGMLVFEMGLNWSRFSRSGFYASFLSGIIFAASLLLLLGSLGALYAGVLRKQRSASEQAEREQQQAVQERAWVRQVAGEDPKALARIELARIALRMRATSMRGDADRLWRRSSWSYRGACTFFLLSLAGPTVAAVLVLDSTAPDWHFMFGGLSLAAVPLGIGTALLRHDTRLREQYQESARDVAELERYELALDYARISSDASYQATLQQVIAQLLTSRGGPVPPRAEEGASAPGEALPGVQKLISVTVDATRDVVGSLVKKNG